MTTIRRRTSSPPPSLVRRARLRAYSMMEILIAMGIFALGFVAVAAIFPAAIHLQKRTMDDIQGQHLAETVPSLFKARPFQLSGPQISALAPGFAVQPMPNLVDPAQPGSWNFLDRSAPSHLSDIRHRQYFWTPLIRRTKDPASAQDYLLYVFILRRDGGRYLRPDLGANVKWAVGTTDPADLEFDGWVDDNSNGNVDRNGPDYWVCPSVRSLRVTGVSNSNRTLQFGGNNNVSPQGGLHIRVGDKILDSNGNIYLVSGADNNSASVKGGVLSWPAPPREVWFATAPSSTAPSPTLDILVVAGAVE